MRLSIVTSAVAAALVSFGGTVAIVIAAAQAVGANSAQTASAVIGLCLSAIVCSTYLGWRYRMPIITAWSAPGIALIAASHGLTPETAAGAFVFAGLLILLTAAIRPLSGLIQKLPVAIAAAMLAGVLFRFCTEVFTAAGADPMLVAPLVVIFLIARQISSSGAVLIVLLFGVAIAFFLGQVGPLPAHLPEPALAFTVPALDLQIMVGVGVPLYIVTMASQNLPGYAVLQSSGYKPPLSPLLAVTALASIATAPLGAVTSNLGALSAAICTGPDSHPSPEKRWLTTPFYALSYVVFGISGAAIVALIAALPPNLIAAFAGLALLGPLVNALGTALNDGTYRFPAVFTFVVTASGVTVFGIGSAFWGILAGLAALGVERARYRGAKGV